MTHVRIYLPTKTATQSGIAKTKHWILEYEQDDSAYKSPLMSWNGSQQATKQVRLKFSSCEEAINYAKKYKLAYKVIMHHDAHHKKKSYSANFMSS